MDYRIIDPMEGDVISEAFEDLLPENYMSGAKNEFFIGAVNKNNEAVGILGFFNEPDRYKIAYLYVEEDERRRGIATLLVESLIGFVDSTEEFKDIEADFTEDAQDIKGFFDNNEHFTVHLEYKSYKITAQEIHNSEKMKLIMDKTPCRDVGLFELKSSVIRKAVKHLREEAGYLINDYNGWEKSCVKDLCRCITNDKGEVDALILLEEKGEKQLILSYLLANSPAKVMSLLKSAVERFVRDYEDYSIEITTVTEAGFKLMEGILPETGHQRDCYKACWNFF